MEPIGLSGGMFSGLGSGMIGLEMPQQPQTAPAPAQNPQTAQNTHHLHHPQMVAYGGHSHEPEHNPSPQPSQKLAYSPYSLKSKPQSPVSDEEEAGFNGDDCTSDGKKKMSPWQRMKWTDSMVRLLIMAVFYIGDEAGSEGNNNDPGGSKKKTAGLSQKKGKWKSVSRAMTEKGFCVSPQQCEDKFNDLNKRYKRVNDILGRGTACKVVENQGLLETMDLSPKMKEEVKKLLNSKHLFFREMCAYHNSCGHGSSGVASAFNHSPEVAADQAHAQHPHATHLQQQKCSHSTANPQFSTNFRTEADGLKTANRVRHEEDDEDGDDESDEDEDDDEDDDDEAIEGHSRDQKRHGYEDDDDHDEKPAQKRQKTGVISLSSSLMQQMSSELMSVIQDGTKSPWEKKQWMKLRLMQLEEQQLSYQCQAVELEKRRLKWVKFSSKKEREMERAKLDNERRRLENERMVLLIRQKELELLDLQQHQQQQLSSNKRSDPSSITG